MACGPVLAVRTSSPASVRHGCWRGFGFDTPTEATERTDEEIHPRARDAECDDRNLGLGKVVEGISDHLKAHVGEVTIVHHLTAHVPAGVVMRQQLSD